MRTKLFFILALLLSADIALADSFTATGALNLTIGTTGVSGTAGLLYGDGATLRSLPGTATIGSNYETLAVGNNVQLSLTTDGTSSNFAATLALINTIDDGGWGNALEVYNNVGGRYSLNTYINSAGIFYSTLNMVISGHYSSGAGTGGHYGGGFSMLSANNNYPNMYDCWADITGSCYTGAKQHRRGRRIVVLRSERRGVFTIGLDAENSQFILGRRRYFVGRAAAGIFARRRGVRSRRRSALKRARRHDQHRRRQHDLPGLGWHGHGSGRFVSVSDRAAEASGTAKTFSRQR